MLRRVLLYCSLALLSILVGLFIGGGPGALRRAEVGAEVPNIATTTTTTTTEPPATNTTDPPSTTTSTTSTTSPAATTSTISTSSSTTVPTSTTTTEPEPEPIGREALTVAVVNGSGVQGIAGRTAGELRAAGYANVVTRNSALIDTTTIYSALGFEREAERLAEDTGLDPTKIVSLDDAPNFGGGEFDLVLVLGTDNQDPGA